MSTGRNTLSANNPTPQNLNHPADPLPSGTPQSVPPLPNYTLSTVCPACTAPTYRHACKVRCTRCGFMWDCSEL